MEISLGTLPSQAPGVYYGSLGSIDPEFFHGQKNLRIVVMDAPELLDKNKDVFKERFADPGKTTAFMMLHPNSSYIYAATIIDPSQTQVSQIGKCLKTIKEMQGIRDALDDAGKLNCTKNVTFVGYDYDPRRIIIVGDERVIMKFFETQPDNGELPGVIADRHASPEAAKIYDDAFKSCQKILCGQTITQNGQPHIAIPKAQRLWDFKVPAWVEDLRP